MIKMKYKIHRFNCLISITFINVHTYIIYLIHLLVFLFLYKKNHISSYSFLMPYFSLMCAYIKWNEMRKKRIFYLLFFAILCNIVRYFLIKLLFMLRQTKTFIYCSKMVAFKWMKKMQVARGETHRGARCGQPRCVSSP